MEDSEFLLGFIILAFQAPATRLRRSADPATGMGTSSWSNRGKIGKKAKRTGWKNLGIPYIYCMA